MASDEQPGSFRAFPDLHFSRVSANRTRSRNYWYFWHNFCPVELMPGFTTHQTMRSDENGVMRRDPYRLADWDYLGWKYSVISSIGTAPINHIINYLPARSIAEFDNFTHNDIKWHRDWLDWTDKHFATLQHLRPILGQPMIGKCDATAAIDGDQGFVFVFNPNYRRLSAEFQLDESIGLTAGDHLVLRQLYPDALKGKLLGRPGKSTYQFGDTVSLEMAGASAAVFAVEPADDQQQPLLLNANGKATLTDDSDLMLSGVIGEYGETVQASAVVPTGKQIHRLIVNGIELPFDQENELVTFQLQFSGQSFSNVQQIGRYDPRLTDNQFEGTSSLPTRIIKQLDSRKKTWPISYNAEELKATWNAPWRKLLFVNIADPSEEMELSASVNGQPLPLKRAYTDIYGYGKNQTLVGWYADLSGIIEADQEFKLDLRLPDNLRPGQFQGVFFDNVEAEYTNELATPEKNPAATARGPT